MKSQSDPQATKPYEVKVNSDERCTVERAADVLSGKWTTLILRDLLAGPKRFGEMRGNLSGISPKTLTDRLRVLEAQGVLTRTIYPEVPPRVVYQLTPKGEALKNVIDAMARWGSSYT